MNHKSHICFFLLWFSTMTVAQDLPKSIWYVTTEQVDQSIVRAIIYYKKVNTEIEIQRLKTPGSCLAESIIIDQVTVDNRVFDFKNSALVEVIHLTINDNNVLFGLKFLPLIDPNNWLLSCQVDVSQNRIGTPQCSKTRIEASDLQRYQGLMH